MTKKYSNVLLATKYHTYIILTTKDSTAVRYLALHLRDVIHDSTNTGRDDSLGKKIDAAEHTTQHCEI